MSLRWLRRRDSALPKGLMTIPSSRAFFSTIVCSAWKGISTISPRSKGHFSSSSRQVKAGIKASFLLLFRIETCPGPLENTKKAEVFSRAKFLALFWGLPSSCRLSDSATGSNSDWNSFSSYSVIGVLLSKA